ncbi:MAG TPA: ATP-binding protein [Polyangiales bacterium]
MRLTRKFVLMLVLGIMVVLTVNAVIRVQREVALFDQDTRRDAALMGAVLAHDMGYAWRTEGESAALSLLRDVAKKSQHVRVRFVWLEAQGVTSEAGLSAADVAQLRAGATVSRRIETGVGALYTYVPVVELLAAPGAVELKETLEDERRYVRFTIVSTVVGTLVLILICAVMAGIVGAVFVGRPTRQLVEKVRRVGSGDLSTPLLLAQQDELGEIAAEINAMSERLAAANERVHKETEDRIAAEHQLRHADRLMTVGKLASGLAHELGTPLNVVSGRAQMIASRESQGDQVQQDARIIVDQTKRMTNIIRQLLDFARPRTSQRAKLDLRGVAQQTLTLLQSLADKRGVQLTLEDSAPVIAPVDPTQLQQVITNLVVNAIHAVSGPGEVRITVAYERARPPVDVGGPEGGYAVLRVNDTGHGMDAETITHIFEPFFTTKDVGEGTGLGLAVTHGIVREHDGWIEVHSEVGRGSMFAVYLPAAGALS